MTKAGKSASVQVFITSNEEIHKSIHQVCQDFDSEMAYIPNEINFHLEYTPFLDKNPDKHNLLIYALLKFEYYVSLLQKHRHFKSSEIRQSSELSLLCKRDYVNQEQQQTCLGLNSWEIKYTLNK